MVSIKWKLSQTECFESTKSNHKQNIFPNKIQFDKSLVDADNNSHANFTKISCKNFSKKKLIFLKQQYSSLFPKWSENLCSIRKSNEAMLKYFNFFQLKKKYVQS